MFLMPIDDPLANAPPDKARVRREPQVPQQIVQQHLRSVRNHDFESDVDSRFSGCPIDNDLFNFPDNWTHTLPECGAMSTSSSSGSADSDEVYYSTPSVLDHSTAGPFSPSSDFGALGMEGDQAEYKEESFDLDGGIDTLSRSPSGDYLQDLGRLPVGFQVGTQATFAFGTSSPYPSPCVLSGYRPSPWQHIDCAATADVHYPPSPIPRPHYPVAGSSPVLTTCESHSMIKFHQEVISHVHVNHGVPWLYNANVGQGRSALHPVCPGINPSLLSMPIPAADHYSEASLYGREHPQEHHYHAAPAGALSSLGSGMQMSASGYPDGNPPLPSPVLRLTTGGGPYYPNPHPTGPSPHTDKVHNNHIPSKELATTAKKKRKPQSTEKTFACRWPECDAAFARTNNLKVHEESVHLGMRPNVCPFAGCQKAENGYSRKHDLDAHIQRKHAAEYGNMSRA